MLQLKVLIRKLLAVDRLATSAVAASKVAALAHKVRDHAVKRRALSRLIWDRSIKSVRMAIDRIESNATVRETRNHQKQILFVRQKQFSNQNSKLKIKIKKNSSSPCSEEACHSFQYPSRQCRARGSSPRSLAQRRQTTFEHRAAFQDVRNTKAEKS